MGLKMLYNRVNLINSLMETEIGIFDHYFSNITGYESNISLCFLFILLVMSISNFKSAANSCKITRRLCSKPLELLSYCTISPSPFDKFVGIVKTTDSQSLSRRYYNFMAYV